MNVAHAAAAASIAGGAAMVLLDRSIDRSGHDPDAPAMRAGWWPIAAPMLLAAGLGAASLVAGRGGAAPALAQALRGGSIASAAAGATMLATRVAWNFLIEPTSVRLQPGDLARNSAERYRLQGDAPSAVERALLDALSRAQGHGPLAAREASGELELPR